MGGRAVERDRAVEAFYSLSSGFSEDGTIADIGHTLVGSRRRRDIGRRSTETLI